VEGWERAIDHIASKIDRIASMIDGYLGHDGSDTQVSARALAMTVRAMKPWAREGRA
jgi:thymidine phosphorylase